MIEITPDCPKCDSDNTRETGAEIDDNVEWECLDCGNKFWKSFWVDKW